MKQPTEMWAIQFRDGTLLYGSFCCTAEGAWDTSFPSFMELHQDTGIDQLKDMGYRAVRVRVEVIEDE